jgi:uncharacterized membrane protein
MWVVLLVVLIGGVALTTVGVLSLFDRLPRNRFAGIRTRTTLASDAAWYRAHRAAGPILVVGSVAVVAVTLAFLPFAAAGKLGSGLTIAVAVLGVVVALMTSVASLVVGTKAAQARARR